MYIRKIPTKKYENVSKIKTLKSKQKCVVSILVTVRKKYMMTSWSQIVYIILREFAELAAPKLVQGSSTPKWVTDGHLFSTLLLSYPCRGAFQKSMLGSLALFTNARHPARGAHTLGGHRFFGGHRVVGALCEAKLMETLMETLELIETFQAATPRRCPEDSSYSSQ